jgi:hypothetical protein
MQVKQVADEFTQVAQGLVQLLQDTLVASAYVLVGHVVKQLL